MRSVILNFAQQFSFTPQINFSEKLGDYQLFSVIGMGGSHLAAQLLKDRLNDNRLNIYNEFSIADHYPPNHLFIISSYSGNTAETLEAAQSIIQKKLPVIIVTTGGQLFDLAQKHQLPSIIIPTSARQPRLAVGYALMALLKIINQALLTKEAITLSHRLKPARLEAAGQALAQQLSKKIPIIYSSQKNYGLALNWKVRLNETGKSPAFFNTFPELTHNELTAPSYSFKYLLLKDTDDAPFIKNQIARFEYVYKKNRYHVSSANLIGPSRFAKIFNSIILADWTSYHIALNNKKDPEQVPMIEEFKKLTK